MLPFLLCIAVYTNLHDTVRFMNPHDIHHYLLALENWLFGGQPVVWAEAVHHARPHGVLQPLLLDFLPDRAIGGHRVLGHGPKRSRRAKRCSG